MRRNLVINPESNTRVAKFATPTTVRGTMNIHSSNIQGQIDGEREDKGFTLIEILIAIVLVGILSAVAVVGISNLVSKGSSSACTATADAAKAASTVYFASTSAFPATLSAMTTGGQLTLPSGVTVNPSAVTAAGTNPGATANNQTLGGTWFLTMTPGVGGVAPTFFCS